MTTGFLGTRPLLPVLTSVGENDLAVKHFQSRKFPSWGYEVEQGATTIWEHWDSYTKAHGFGGMDGKQNASMNSFAHYSFGAVCEWMINDLAGIQSDGAGLRQNHHPSASADARQRSGAQADRLGQGTLRFNPRPHREQLEAAQIANLNWKWKFPRTPRRPFICPRAARKKSPKAASRSPRLKA